MFYTSLKQLINHSVVVYLVEDEWVNLTGQNQCIWQHLGIIIQMLVKIFIK